jgi:16S rRNA C1402 N4-methylase RsmH
LDRWPKDLPLDLSLRNKQGETVYSIANDLKDEKALKILKSYEERYGDKS